MCPFLSTLFFVSLWFAASRWTWNRLPQRVEVTHCLSCKYSLEGLPKPAQCPECGEPNPSTRVVYGRAPAAVDEERRVLQAGDAVFVLMAVAFLLPVVQEPLWRLMYHTAWWWQPPLVFTAFHGGTQNAAAFAAIIVAVAFLCAIAVVSDHARVFGFLVAIGLLSGNVVGLTAAWLDWQGRHPRAEAIVFIGVLGGGCTGGLVFWVWRVKRAWRGVPRSGVSPVHPPPAASTDPAACGDCTNSLPSGQVDPPVGR